MKIALASDHAGFELKEKLKKYLEQYEIIDFGTSSPDSMDYPDTGFPAAEAVSSGKCQSGIFICGSGIGMSIVANKVKGIRGSLVYDAETAALTRKHNNPNVLILAGRYLSFEQAIRITDTWLNTSFEGGRHQRRLDKIAEYENRIR